MTAVQMFTTLITNPRRAFTELEKNPRFAAPMLLLLAASIGMVVWFYSIVDVDWLINQVVAARPVTPAQRAQLAAFMSRGTMMGGALFSAVLLLFVVQLVQAFYFYFIFTFLEVQLSFKKWFALGWWCSLPNLISVLVAIVMLSLHGSSQVSTSLLTPLSLNQLFFHYELSDPGYSLLTSIDLMQLLTIVLLVIGVQTWSKRSWVLSAVVVLLPRLVVYGVWGWFAFR